MAFWPTDRRQSLSSLYEKIYREDESDNLWASLLKGTHYVIIIIIIIMEGFIISVIGLQTIVHWLIIINISANISTLFSLLIQQSLHMRDGRPPHSLS